MFFFLYSLFENMDKICDDNYIPSPTDVLRARVRTNGIIETNFRVNDTIIRLNFVKISQIKYQNKKKCYSKLQHVRCWWAKISGKV